MAYLPRNIFKFPKIRVSAPLIIIIISKHRSLALLIRGAFAHICWKFNNIKELTGENEIPNTGTGIFIVFFILCGPRNECLWTLVIEIGLIIHTVVLSENFVFLCRVSAFSR